MTDAGKRGWRARVSARKAAIIGSVAFVVLLTAVIFTLSAMSSPDSDGSDGGGAPTASSERTWGDYSISLTEQGVEALESGDTTAAVALFSQALVLDPANEKAETELAKISVAKTGSNGTSSGGDASDSPDDSADGGNDGSSGDDSAFTQPVSDITVLLPQSATGYELSLATALGPDATVSGDPVQGGPREVRRVLFSVHDAQTVTKANGYISTVAEQAFPQNDARVTVDGVSAYFGTDGVRFASVAFVRGRYAFQVILTTDSGSPGSLLDVAVEAAKAFPDSL